MYAVWMFVGLALILSDMATLNMVTAPIGLAAVAASIFAMLDMPVVLQAAVFAMLAAALVILTRPLKAKLLHVKDGKVVSGKDVAAQERGLDR